MILLGALCIILFSSCSFKNDDSPKTGGIAFSLVFENPHPSNKSSKVSMAAAPDVCVDYGLANITGTVMDSSNATVKSEIWQCSAHQGTISGVPVGSGYTLQIEGKDASNTWVLWKGNKTSITVYGGETTNTGTVTITYIGTDKTAPYIVSSSETPTQGAANVPVTSSVKVTFNEAMAASSINNSTFLLNDGATNISGNVSYDSTTKVATFAPASNLTYSIPYTATVTTGVTDMAGNYMTVNKTWSFTTEQAPTTVPPAPTNVNAMASDKQVDLSWNASTGATSYNVYWSTGANPVSKTTYAGTVNVLVTSYTHTGLTNGLQYNYVVTAMNSYGESAESTPVKSATPSATPPAAPTGVTAASGAGRVFINWDPVGCASSYNIYWSTISGNATKTAGSLISSLTGTSYVHMGLKNGTTYYYAVTAICSSMESNESSVASAAPASTLDTTPPVITGSNPAAASAGFTITGNVIAIFNEALSEASINNTKMTLSDGVNPVPGTAFVGTTSNRAIFNPDANLLNNIVYTVTVKAGVTDKFGNALASDYTWTFRTEDIPSTAPTTAPGSVIASPADNSVVVYFGTTNGATQYNLYYSTLSGVTTTSNAYYNISRPYTFSGTNGTTYYFRVAAENGYGIGPLSPEVSATPTATPLAAPVITSIVPADGQVTVSWDPVQSATSYRIYWSHLQGVTIDNGFEVNNATSPYTMTGLTNGTTYYFTVRAINYAQMSALSSEVSAVPNPPGEIQIGW